MFNLSINDALASNDLLFVVDLGVKSLVIMLLAWSIAFAFRRRSAAVLHRIWGYSFKVLLLVTFLMLVSALAGGRINRQIVAVRITSSTSNQAAPHSSAKTTVALSTTDGEANRPAVFDTGQAPSFNQPSSLSPSEPTPRNGIGTLLFTTLITVWVVGMLFNFAKIAQGLYGNHAMHRRADVIANQSWLVTLQRLQAQFGIWREVKLMRSRANTVPMTWGFFSPAIIMLPSNSDQWSEAKREIVLLHELAHVERNDIQSQTMANVACAVFWFNPLTWYGFKMLQQQQELACDDRVLAKGIRGSEYANQLVSMMENYLVPQRSAAVPITGASKIEQRVAAMLDSARTHLPVSRRCDRVLGICAMSIMAAMVMFQGIAVAAPVQEAAPATVQNEEQTTEQKGNQDESFQGEIRSIRGPGRGNVVMINLGSDDGLRRGVTFGVVDNDSLRPENAKVKATIRITTILGAHYAQGRIVAQAVDEDLVLEVPIVIGDKIYSPFWSPGKKLKIAVIGEIDLDGDGMSDNELIGTRLRKAGVEVVFPGVNVVKSDKGIRLANIAWFDDSFQFIVEGNLPYSDSEDQTEAFYDEIFQAGLLRHRAQELGITVLSVRKLHAFLDANQ